MVFCHRPATDTTAQPGHRPAQIGGPRRAGREIPAMYDAPQMFVLAFLIGLTGALAPGPTLVATINTSLAGGWKAGPKIVLGHMAAELVIFALIILGLSALLLPYAPFIAGVGGVSLIVFGALTISAGRHASMNAPATGAAAVTNPYVAGLVTSAANPYFWIWWLTIGCAMVLAGLEGGIFLAAVFMAGHWCADLGWYTVVSTGIAKGKSVLSDRTYRLIMGACGIFLVLFGAYYLSGVFVAG
jgi:threonine/homoserine/homoserine lactone efflux protein